MTDFLFIYEHVNREIENDLLVMHELEKRGYRCELISFYGPDYVKWRLLQKKAKVVIVPWLRYDTDLRRFVSLSSRPYKIVNAQCEQVTNEFGAPGMEIVSQYAKDVFYFCWGKKRKEELISYGIKDDNIRIVGALQQDYGRPELSDYYMDRASIANHCGLNSQKKWVLFISSFSGVCWSAEAVNQAALIYGEDYHQYHDLEIRSQKEIVDWLRRLCTNQEYEVIYRPHPSETNSKFLKAAACTHNNFHIINDYSVKQWASVCDSVNLWISTSNAELFSMDIPYNILRPYCIPYKFDMPTFLGEKFITNYNSFKDVVSDNNVFSEYVANYERYRPSLFLDYYSYDKDYPAYKRNADALIGIFKMQQSALSAKNLTALSHYSSVFFKDIVKSIIIKIDQLFPRVQIVEKLPVSNDARNLLRTRSDNYKNKKDGIARMKEYLSREFEPHKEVRQNGKTSN